MNVVNTEIDKLATVKDSKTDVSSFSPSGESGFRNDIHSDKKLKLETSVFESFTVGKNVRCSVWCNVMHCGVVWCYVL